ncbi:putative High mobility group protein HMGA [Rosa chinensis]|uniref:Putative High mobility group protein HMGA n=1 Tax=Rosa chinensis TaxID=74649 RepID=A0A2P6P1W4_ROSCH|nr:ras-associated and pleckstrin homology domains-containing protein 1 [Rosa chinensis]PRQ15914.1 putative High mobility group protein HMGA [Rosa chinensis]
MDPPPPPNPNPYPPPPIPTSAATISAVPTAVEPDNNAAAAHVAANPTHAPAPTFNHPPYAEMIYTAIAALKERDGSSRRAIAKYIEQVYPSLPPTHSALLTRHLKRLKNSGHLEMVKKSYKIPGPPRSDAPPPPATDSPAPTSVSSPGQPRGRGRPPKPKPEQQQPQLIVSQPQQHQYQQHILQQPIPIPQQPIPIPQQPFPIPQQPIPISHPPFPISQQSFPISQQPIPFSQQPFSISQQPISVSIPIPIPIPIPQQPIPIPQQHPIVQPNFQSFPQPTLPQQSFPEPNVQQQPNSQPMPVDEPKKRPGRPRKAPAALAIGQNSPVVSAKRGRGRPPGSRMSKKRPGRPPKPKTVSSVSGSNGLVKRRPGRPSKAEPRTVFIPYATNVPIIGAFEQTNGPGAVVPQPAPRPRGRPKKDKSAAASSGVAAGSGKPRGRPPLVPGVERPKLSRSGRPVGRPKKDASLAITAAPDPNLAANAELKRKLEYFQLRVGEAVGVLKPFLNNESTAGVAAAIQELEGLATLDITAPLNIATQQPALQS